MSGAEAIRLTIFAAVFGCMAAWEALAPRRPRTLPRRRRWSVNLLLAGIDVLVVRLVLPGATAAAALWAADRGWGLFNYFSLPSWLAVFGAVVALDLVIYAQHAAFHRVPWLWRLHRVHHTDLDFDVTTALRFHPLEICASMLIKLSAVLALGAPALAVLVFDVLLNALAMFNHGNVALGPLADRLLRLLVVTPDMHRVHHAIDEGEQNTNFGFNLSVWDRLFRTYCAKPEGGQLALQLGVAGMLDAGRSVSLPHLLAQPFLASVKPKE